MKKIDYSRKNQVAAHVAAANIAGTETFWDRVQAQWEKMTSGPDIRPRQPQAKTRTQTEHYGN